MRPTFKQNSKIIGFLATRLRPTVTLFNIIFQNGSIRNFLRNLKNHVFCLSPPCFPWRLSLSLRAESWSNKNFTFSLLMMTKFFVTLSAFDEISSCLHLLFLNSFVLRINWLSLLTKTSAIYFYFNLIIFDLNSGPQC